MPDLNAGLLQINDLAGVIGRANQQKQAEQDNLLGKLGTAATAIKGSFDQEALNNALSKNFDPNTQQLNQDGVIKDLYAGGKQQLAQQLSQQFQTQKLANMKGQADYAEKMSQVGLNNANAGKATSEVDTSKLKNILDKQNALGQLIVGVDHNNPASLKKTLAFAKSNGFDTSLFDDVNPNNPEQIKAAKAEAMGHLVTANDQLKARIDQQNADTNVMNAQTNADKNAVDREKNALEQARLGYISPEQQFNMQKQQNEFKTSQIKNVNEVQDKINSTNYTIEQAGNVSKAAERLLSSKFISKGKDPKTGEYIPQDSNELGGFWGTLTGSSMNPLKTDAKAFATDYNLMVSGLKNNGVAQLKANVGSQGTITDSDAKMVADAQGAPSTAEELAKLPISRQFEAINTLKKVNDRVIEINKEKNKKLTQQYGDIENQSLSVPQPRVAQPMAGNGNNDLSSLAPQTPPRGLPPIDMFNKPVQAPNGAVINKAKAQAIINFLNQ